MSKIRINQLEFYITNVCNLTCDHCRSFNNFNFSGMYEFNKEAIAAWAEKLDFVTGFSILGGEPTLHPRLHEWVKGLAEAWPDAPRKLITNGTYLSKVPNLHDMLAEYKYHVLVSTHGYHLRELIAKELFLAFGDCTLVRKSYFENGVNGLHFLSSKGVTIEVQNGNLFQEVCFTDDNFNLYNNDAELAHSLCDRRCNHMIDNKIYKCSVVGLLPTFLKQQNKDTSHVLPYNGIDVESFTQQSLIELNSPIPHCAVCSVNPNRVEVNSDLKKNRKLIRIFESKPV